MEDAHPAIISAAEWRAAQAARGVTPLRSADGALLAGLLRCGGCRYVMKPDTLRTRDGVKLRQYRCRGDHAAGRCPAPSSVLTHVIEDHVTAEFFAALGPDGVLAQAATSDAEQASALTSLGEAEHELAEWLEAVSPATVGRAAYTAALEVRQERVDTARQAVHAAEKASTATLPPAADLQEVWPTLSTPERRKLLSAGIDAIFLRRGHVIADRSLILYAGEAPSDLPSRGRRVPLASFAWPDAPVNAGIAVA
jgi:hypothetical protein